jgi:hypothetical protein
MHANDTAEAFFFAGALVDVHLTFGDFALVDPHEGQLTEWVFDDFEGHADEWEFGIGFEGKLFLFVTDFASRDFAFKGAWEVA